MKRTEPLSISQIVDQLFKSRDMEDSLLRHRALQVWPEVVGPIINRQTVERRLAGDILLLRIASAPMRSELTMHRSSLIKALNDRVGKKVIAAIKFI